MVKLHAASTACATTTRPGPPRGPSGCSPRCGCCASRWTPRRTGAAADLAAPWAAVRDLLPDRLLRRLDRSTTDPGSIRFRATAVEEFTLRSEPTEAYVELVVSAGDSPTLGTARAVNGINVLVLAGVAVLLGIAHADQRVAGRRAGHAAHDLPDPAGQPAASSRTRPGWPGC